MQIAKKLLFGLSLYFFILTSGYNGYSQPFTGIHFTMSVENCAQVAPNQLEFSMQLQFDDTISYIELLSYAFGVNYSTSILNGGIATVSQVMARDAALINLATPNLANVTGTTSNGGTATNQVRITQSIRNS